MPPSIAHIVVGLPVDGPFDYLIPEHLAGKVLPGARVTMVFARRKRVGYVVGLAETSSFKDLNAVITVLDDTPVFSAGALVFAKALADQCGCSWGEALELTLPAYLRKPRAFQTSEVGTSEVGTSEVGVELRIASSIEDRWAVALEAVQAELKHGRGVLCLVPETSVLEEAARALAPAAKGGVGVILKSGTEKEEYDRWLKVRSGHARLALGFISAVFAPVDRLGLIVIIDEESSFYKHDQSPFYHAREAALLRARLEGVRVLCVSSAPSVEMWHEVSAGRARMPELPVPAAPVRMLDLSNFKIKKGDLLSPLLCQEISRVAAEGGVVFLYIQASRGVQGVLEEVRKKLPLLKAAGYDKASGDIPSGVSVIVGTQAVFRHRALFRPALSAVLDIDWELHRNDHRAAHSAFVLVRYLRQMSGTVVLQTRDPAAPALPFIAAQDMRAFYNHELEARREAGLPPVAGLVAVVVRAEDPLLAEREAGRFYDTMQPSDGEGVEVWEPQPDRTPMVRGKFRYCVMVRGVPPDKVIGRVMQRLRAFRPKRDVVVTVNVNP